VASNREDGGLRVCPVTPAQARKVDVTVAEQFAVAAQQQPLGIVDDKQPVIASRDPADVAAQWATFGTDGRPVAAEVVPLHFGQTDDVVVFELL